VTGTLSIKPIFFVMDYLNATQNNHLLLNKVEWASNVVMLGLLIKLGAAPIHQ